MALLVSLLAGGLQARAGEWRALWVDNGTLARLGGREGVAALMAQARQAGFQAVLVESLFRGYTLYPGPYQDPRFASWPEDPLEVAVEEARRQGLQVHAWMWALAAGMHGEAGPVLAAHPEWADQGPDGSPFAAASSGMPWLDPSRPEVRAFLAEQAVQIARDYGVDGIQLDYIRYPNQWEAPFGYSPHARQAFFAATGIELAGRRPDQLPPSQQQAWQRWREEQVTAVVAEVRRALRHHAPGVLLSAAVAPELSVARWLYLQDWRRWLADGLVDFVALMAYTSSPANLQDILGSLERDLRELSAWRDPAALKRRVVVGLGLFGGGAFSLAEQIERVRAAGAAGVAVFAAAYLTRPLQELLAQGPFREPAGLPELSAREVDPPVPWLPVATGALPLPAILARPAGPTGMPPPDPAELNLARRARVRVDSSFPGYGPKPLTDGVRNDVWEVGRWAQVAWASAERPGEHWVELRWPQPVQVAQVDIYWALDRGRFFASQKLRLEAEGPDGQWYTLWEYRLEPASGGVRRTSVTFVPVTTRALRLVQPDGAGPAGRPHLMWVAEVEVYG